VTCELCEEHASSSARGHTYCRRGTIAARDLPAGEVERVLRVKQNFTILTCTIPMVKIEDLPPSMQPHVVGAPRMWVWIVSAFGKHY
jgi:hypothetical protein